MSRRFLAAIVCLSATTGMLLGLVIAGSMSPASAISAPPRHAVLPKRVTEGPPTPQGAVSFADIAERVNPAVVNIDATSRDGYRPRRRSFGPTQPDRQDRPPGDLRRGTGTGFLIDADGLILTNQHVIEFADRLRVRLKDGRSLPAERVGADPDTDIAVLRVHAPGPLPFVALGDSDRLRVGEWVVAIGNPLTYEHTVTVGIVSFIGRKLFDRSFDRYIQTDAAINFGNSGGPLLNTRGEVVGINSAISSSASNIGFAVPINQATAILPQLVEDGHVSRGYIGVGLRDVDPDLQRSLGLRTSQGALVQDVTAGSPASRAGIRIYDLIVAVDGRSVSGNDELVQLIAARRPGSTAQLHVVRDDRPVTIAVKLAERPGAGITAAPDRTTRSDRPAPALGLSVREIDPDTAVRAQLPDGMTGLMVSRVEPLSPAFDARIERGHVLLEINREPIRTLRDYERVLGAARPGDVLALQVYKPESLQRELHTLNVEP